MANVRWKDKANLAGASIADADAMPITDDVAGAATDKHVLMSDIATYINTKNASATATLTNKSIDSDNNTITNIVNADIKAAAAIAVNKLAAVTASKVLVSDGSGFISADGTTQAELSILDGATCTTAELNLLDAGEDEAVFDGGANVTIRAGGANQVIVTDGTIEPVTDNDVDLGAAGKEFKDGYFDGTVICDGVTCGGTASLSGTVTQTGGAVGFNLSEGDYDFQVRGDTDTNLFYIDASTDMVGVGVAAPIAKLDVAGTFNVTGTATVASCNYAVATGGTDEYTITLAPALVSYTAGLTIYFKADINNTGACTLKVNGMASKAIKLQDGTDPANDDIDIRGITHVVYDGTNFVLMNPL